jgi:hypothetical protein
MRLTLLTKAEGMANRVGVNHVDALWLFDAITEGDSPE